MKKNELVTKIEQKRKQLHIYVSKFGILSNEVLRCSEELDVLINIYLDLKE
ncbi:aspartyl-phosphate phosphatase Spo0E family protein [Halalkalibacter krulwichiae]|uniref:Spo0E like sporulation regulatory protein n=1 Tax=Halalkalibacter krulwichiae TaxID=199441 RepID=A0A1X9M8P5_9BACI|nr:aspartyl-phosphate phosphatase Spo0E family protein [Halalkalibacter krulwichiae]ARK29757.1 Spo0E like sporulation regulatory protein [Halalkalibacter krulwichiae]